MSLALDLNSPGNWELVHSALHEEEEGNRAARLPLIPPFELTTLIQSPIVRITATNLRAKPTWRRAGYLTQTVVAANPENTIFNNEPLHGMDVESKLVLLNNAQLLQYQSLTADYYLWFNPLPWIPRFYMKVWSFKGEVQDRVLDELETVKIDVIRAESKIDRLLNNAN